MKKTILKIALVLTAAMLIVAPASAEKTDIYAVNVADQTTGASATSTSGHGTLVYPHQVEEVTTGPYPVTYPYEVKEKEPGKLVYPYQVEEATTDPYPVTYPYEVKEKEPGNLAYPYQIKEVKTGPDLVAYPYEIKDNNQGTSTGSSGGHGSSAYAIRVEDNQASPSITTEVKENTADRGFDEWFDTVYDHMKRTYYIVTLAGFDTENAREILESMNDYRGWMENSTGSFDSTEDDRMKDELRMLMDKFYTAIGDSFGMADA